MAAVGEPAELNHARDALALNLELSHAAGERPGVSSAQLRRVRAWRALRLCAALAIPFVAGAAASLALSRVALAPGARLAPPRADDHVPRALTKLAFGSCARAELPQPFWRPIVDSRPDVFVFAGDIVYGDCLHTAEGQSCAPLDEAWAKLGAHADFRLAREAALPIVGMLDDHDSGQNDCGAQNPFRSYAKRAFLDFFAVPESDVWRTRPGLYRSRLYDGRAPDGARRVTQLLLLDVRSFREPEWRAARAPAPGHERYEEETGVRALGASILGDEQWAWLDGQLRTPADLRVVVSTIQVLPLSHGWERWGLFPHELARLVGALRAAGGGAVLLSGDRHLGALYKYTPDAPQRPPAQYPNSTAAPERSVPAARARALFELTSSSLTHAFGCTTERPCAAEEGPMLGGRPLVHENNWGELAVDWRARTLTLALRRASNATAADGRRLGDTLLQHVANFDELGM
ncbi:hypothetical protein KFE25_010130 [Diacronema lutheri]|uniref:PhoD-like phosphatase metallophosphatase domain-containing protein n=2 Tax=Diacronema lutheri TaxID=2081491 RepID=A0A8J5XMW6_DIALT|nr:hypothetical protein KFE25_010130 [Diacronema lutheri]